MQSHNNSFDGEALQYNSNPQETMSIVKHQHADTSSTKLIINTKSNKTFQRLIIYFHTANFMKKLQRYLKPAATFQLKHFLMIGDMASGNVKDFLACKLKPGQLQFTQLEELSWTVKFRYFQRQVQKILNLKMRSWFDTLPLLDPSHKIKLTWDVILNLGRLYFIFLIPILLVFEEQMQDNNTQLIFASILYLLDMILRSVTIYYEQGLPVRDRYAILRNQIHWASLSEFIGILIMFIFAVEDYDLIDEFILQGGWPKLLLVLYFFQLKNLLQFINQWQHSLTLGKATSSIIELIKLIGLLLLILHIFSCFWLVIGNYQLIQSKPNWITSNELTMQPWYELYLNALYYMSVTMFTVGYGDIHPVNSYEKLFSVIVMFSCTLQLSYSVNTIGNILREIKERNKIIKQKLTCINQFMDNKKIDHSLQYQVREYLNFYWFQEQIQQTQEQTEIIHQLSDDLQTSLAVESNRSVLKNCDFFHKNFSEAFIYELLKSLTFKTFQPQSIVPVGDSDFYVNIIETGEITAIEKRSANEHEQQLGTLRQGDTIGLETFLSGQMTERIVYKANGFVSVLVISQQNFINLLRSYPSDLEVFWTFRNKAELGVIAKCIVCGSGRHNSESCSLIHYSPDRERIIKGYLFCQDQDRMMFVRNRRRQKHLYHAFTDKEFTAEAARVLRLGNDSALFERWSPAEDRSSLNELPPPPSRRLEQDSIQLLIRDIEDSVIYAAKTHSITQYAKFQSDCVIEHPLSEEKTEAIATLTKLQLRLRNKATHMPSEIDQIIFLVKYLEMKYQKQDTYPFEVIKEYEYYAQQNNFNTVLKKYNYFNMRDPLGSQDMDNNINQWIRYMFYPIDFFTQYRKPIRKSSIEIEDKQTIIRKKQMQLSTHLQKKRKEKRYIRRAMQVFPVQH